MVICPNEKWDIVAGKRKARNNAIAKSNLGGRLLSELNQTIAINDNRLIILQLLLACWRGSNPIAQNTPIAVGIHTALPIS